ncbi:hypothetical protein SAMN05216511_6428 [Streptomyces sp. KS_16]|nr:hypothetical protein BX261_0791 [Streptomyces sp. 2321.6]SDR56882.1 hypothetical protein SAMN05216511_6428 [Streptomyces sp. KS_16]SEB94671.1 hypothetical protein SAMN05428940_0790 [Streptomyces sp. 2133.1]SNC62910.1 hypothetical protein SAMN06272741_0788 [Streptomyces sp. 2114.4]
MRRWGSAEVGQYGVVVRGGVGPITGHGGNRPRDLIALSVVSARVVGVSPLRYRQVRERDGPAATGRVPTRTKEIR